MEKLDKPCLLDIPKIHDPRGNLSFIEERKHIPFKIERTYWIYDVPGGEARGGHAFRENEEFVVALSGSFDIIVDDGKRKRKFCMSRSYYGLYIPKGLWRTLENFSTNSLALEFGSRAYSRADYIDDYERFLALNGDEEI